MNRLKNTEPEHEESLVQMPANNSKSLPLKDWLKESLKGVKRMHNDENYRKSIAKRLS